MRIVLYPAVRAAFAGVLLMSGACASTPHFSDVALPIADANRCFDVAAVGWLIEVDAAVSLADLIPSKVWLGALYDFRVRIEDSSAPSILVSQLVNIQAIATSQPVRDSAMLFFLQKLPDQRWFAVEWRWAERDASGHFGLSVVGQPDVCTSGHSRIPIQQD